MSQIMGGFMKPKDKLRLKNILWRETSHELYKNLVSTSLIILVNLYGLWTVEVRNKGLLSRHGKEGKFWYWLLTCSYGYVARFYLVWGLVLCMHNNNVNR